MLIGLKWEVARGATLFIRYITPPHHQVFIMKSAKGLWGGE